ncbi:MAG: hypothetical protein II336_18040 [Loktanella sp.]|nr:hypothetical protein [Loktanella sp.]
MTSRLLKTPEQRDEWVALLQSRKLPMTVTAISGRNRTNEQNRLQRKWVGEVSEQRGDITAEEARGYSKLHFGVPILRNEDEEFVAVYDRIIRPLPYEDKLSLMQVPIDLPVTSRMNTGQKKRYLDAMFAHWTAQGVVLTMPEDCA